MNEPTSNRTAHSTPRLAIERRVKPRIRCDYPAQLRGQSVLGTRIETTARALNMSAGGFYLETCQSLEINSRAFVVIRFSSTIGGSPAIAAHGRIVRSETRADGTRGIAVQLSHYRFL